ncbi:hypothetical protein Tco_1227479 [Tanacetum coccineum]
MVSVVLAGCSRVVGLAGGFGCVSSASDQTRIRYAAEVVVGESGGCSLDSEGSHLQLEDDGVVVAVAVVKMLDNLAKRIVYLAFHVIPRLLETSSVRDITEWEEDADEYIRKNLPSELEEISGLRDDLFTPKKSALNLLGVI